MSLCLYVCTHTWVCDSGEMSTKQNCNTCSSLTVRETLAFTQSLCLCVCTHSQVCNSGGDKHKARCYQSTRGKPICAVTIIEVFFPRESQLLQSFRSFSPGKSSSYSILGICSSARSPCERRWHSE